MWYEILPSFLVVTGAFAFGNYFIYFTNNLVLKQAFKRDVAPRENQWYFLRDFRISGGYPYRVLGLDNIPDLPGSEPESKQVVEEDDNSGCKK